MSTNDCKENSFSSLLKLIQSKFRNLTGEKNVSKDGVPFLFVRKRNLFTSFLSYAPSLYIICIPSNKDSFSFIHLRLLTYHGHVIDEEEISVSHRAEASRLFSHLDSDKFFHCSGIPEEKCSSKLSFDSVFLEHWKEKEIVVRSRKCKYVTLIANQNCSECDFLNQNKVENEESVSEKMDEESSSSTEEIGKKSTFPSISCSICLQKFTRKGAYHRHSKLHEERMKLDELINCPLCSQINLGKKSINAHIHECHDSTQALCTLCFSLMTNDALPRHFERIHNYETKKHLCSECGRKFKFPGDLKCHMATAHDSTGDKSVICEHCGKILSHQTALTKHVRRTHNKHKVFGCQICSRVFFENYRLQKHLKTHTGLKPFKCLHCDYASARKDNVVLHVKKIHKLSGSSNDVETINYLVKNREEILQLIE